MSTPQQPSPAAVREALASRHWPVENLAVLRAHIRATAQAMREEAELTCAKDCMAYDERLFIWADRLEGRGS